MTDHNIGHMIKYKREKSFNLMDSLGLSATPLLSEP
jgi:hypothetical protein